MPRTTAVRRIPALAVGSLFFFLSCIAAAAPISHRFDNGLKFLGVPTTGHKALVALGVEAGSFQDPDSTPGLAHLVEHLLLDAVLNTGDGQPTRLRDYLALRGGRQDANTLLESTHYLFEMDVTALPDFLGHLRQVLLAPEFPADALSTEIVAIDEEYALIRDKPAWQLQDALKAVAPADHPFRRFTAGNASVFSGMSSEVLLQQVKDFIARYYQPQLMSLVVSAPGEAGQILAMAEQAFGRVPATAQPVPASAPLLPQETMPTLLGIHADKSDPQLDLLVELQGESRALRNVVRLLEQWSAAGGDGNFRAQLQATGLIKNAAIGRGLSTRDHPVLRITAILTDRGRADLPAVIATLLAATEALVKQLPLPTLDTRNVASPAVNAEGIHDPVLTTWLSNMRHLPEEGWAAGEVTLSDEQHRAATAHITGQLQAQRTVAILSASDAESDSVSPFLHTAYRITPLPQAQIAAFTATREFAPFAAPAVPSATAPAQTLAARAGVPELTTSTPQLTTWFSETDEASAAGHIFAGISFSAPAFRETREGRVLWSVWYKLLTEDMPPIQDGSVRWYQHAQGAGAQLDGSSTELSQQLQLLMSKLQTPVAPADFERARQQLLTDWHARADRFAYQQLVRRLKQILMPGQDPVAARIDVLEKLKPEQLQRLQASSFGQLEFTLYTYGASREQAAVLSSAVAVPLARASDTEFNDPMLARPIPVGAVIQERLALDGNNGSLLRYQQLPSASPEDTALSRMLLPLMRRHYFSVLREQQKLAYGVTVIPVDLLDSKGLALIAESAQRSPRELAEATDRFLDDFPRWLGELSENDFADFKLSLSHELDTSHLRGRELAQYYWSQVTAGRTEFSWSDAEQKVIETTSADELLAFYERAIHGVRQRAVVLEGWQHAMVDEMNTLTALTSDVGADKLSTSNPSGEARLVDTLSVGNVAGTGGTRVATGRGEQQ